MQGHGKHIHMLPNTCTPGNTDKEIVNACFAHLPGLSQLARTSCIDNLTIWREDDGGWNSLFDEAAVGVYDVEVLVKIADVNLDDAE